MPAVQLQYFLSSLAYRLLKISAVEVHSQLEGKIYNKVWDPIQEQCPLESRVIGGGIMTLLARIHSSVVISPQGEDELPGNPYLWWMWSDKLIKVHNQETTCTTTGQYT